MDQHELYALTTRTIQAYDTDRAVPHSDVSAIANMLFDCAGKDSRHGYVRKSETIFWPTSPKVVLGKNGIVELPIKAKFQKSLYRDGELLRVVHAKDKRDVLIVICKSDSDCNGGAMEHICATITISNFPVGLLLSQRRAFFFFQGKNDDEGIQPGPEFSDISKHVPEIADIIRDL
ncbi:hypothetical protein IWQ62_001396 [Dispira parvispora]|uniref:Uncharacterized protein n=1 Tax=Dispira parvispora TaxID=1520584 RepID=A0A9W8ATN7_9FUNG|nr:hypothetical protein IWQ62_001396 [Dispira parvispora]